MADGYSAAEAQQVSDARRQAAAKRFISPNTVFYVAVGLGWKWSPEQISAVCKHIGDLVSRVVSSKAVKNPGVYRMDLQYVQTDKTNGGELYKLL
ncbi:hypothetical protein L2D25_14720 [Salmonella enterica subsp. enterica serovar Muenchen]|uniref:hypothetical protein n=1 Tax=Salmonella enterica TaxID=28901 RepID=UPI001F0CFE31|nr:hypothetical protein [Salmonella enterica]MCH5442707.1 hypothetical protein [Salmonella enterica subsp. enterica serovar Muenchen]